jgi:hypothetical protein
MLHIIIYTASISTIELLLLIIDNWISEIINHLMLSVLLVWPLLLHKRLLVLLLVVYHLSWILIYHLLLITEVLSLHLHVIHLLILHLYVSTGWLP